MKHPAAFLKILAVMYWLHAAVIIVAGLWQALTFALGSYLYTRQENLLQCAPPTDCLLMWVPAIVMGVVALIVGLFTVLISLASYRLGQGLYRQHGKGRCMGLAVVHLFIIPVGSFLGILTLVALKHRDIEPLFPAEKPAAPKELKPKEPRQQTSTGPFIE